MEHLILKAVTTVTDEGVFEAVISTATIDRELDIVEPQAMVDALRKWVPLGKKVPLRWNHGTDPEHIIGHIDPESARVVNAEVIVSGRVDQKAKRGADAWRLVKSGTLGFSFGYLITAGTKRQGGGRHITGMDVFEVTASHAPMNGDTRVVAWKSTEELKRESTRLEREIADEQIGVATADLPTPTPPEVPPTADDVLALLKALPEDQIDAVRAALPAQEPPPLPPDPVAQRKQSRQIERELADEKIPEVTKAETPSHPVTKALDGVDPNALTAEQVASTLDTLALKAGDQDVHLHVRVVTADELDGVKSGEIKAVWSASYINNLPDSAFLLVEPGGSKDSEGKTTPRSLRHFPYKDADGNIDLPHLRNALARIPQSNLSQEVKDRLIRQAQRVLDQQKSVDVTDKEPRARSVDPLRRRSEELALEIASDGMSQRRPPTKAMEPKREGPSSEELKRRSRDLMFEVLSYGME